MVAAAVVSDPVRGLGPQLSTQAQAAVYYLKLLWMPVTLSVEHGFTLARGLWEPPVLLSIMLLLSLATVVWRSSRIHRGVRFWSAWGVVALLPASLTPLNVLVNEHRLYMTSVVFAVMGAALLINLERLGKGRVLLSALLLVVFGSLCLQRIGVWETPQALWGDAATKGPYMPRPHIFLGDHHKLAGEYEAALSEYDLALTVYPQHLSGGDLLTIYNNRGSTYLSMGRTFDAIQSYRRAVSIDSTYARSKEALAGLVAFEGDWDEAAKTLYKRALLLIWKGQAADSVGLLKRSLAIQLKEESLMTLALSYGRLGNREKEMETYENLKLLFPETGWAETAELNLRRARAEDERE